jgi:hypothetical protein
MVALQKLGLQEAEAVEYALMLSHEEAIKAGVPTHSSTDDSGENHKSQKGPRSTSSSPPSASLRTSPPLHTSGKVQVARLEPMSVGGLPSPTRSVSRATSAEEFPSISESTSPSTKEMKHKMQGHISTAEGSPSVAGQVTPPTPTRFAPSSWSAVVKSSRHDTEKDKKGKKKSAITQGQLPPPTNDEEAQLQFALELSLAEALSDGSRGG